MKGHVNHGGYVQVWLTKNKTKKMESIHRLILLTFIGPCPIGMECIHLDDNRKNNNVLNLKWGTRSENALLAFKRKRRDNKNCKNPYSKLTIDTVLEIKNTYKQGNVSRGYWKILSKKLNISPSTIVHILKGRTWKNAK